MVKVNDILRVLPGESIPVDGVILSGQTSINQAVMTGESLPVDKAAGDMVSSGTVNQFGSFDMKATKVDVYKRQLHLCVRNTCRGKRRLIHLFRYPVDIVDLKIKTTAVIGLNIDAGKRHIAYFFIRYKTCLLYTSRCV